LGGGGFPAYLGNRSEAEIDHPEGGPVRGERSESNLSGFAPCDGGERPTRRRGG